MAAESVSVNKINRKKTSESASYAKLDSNIWQKARQPFWLTRFSLNSQACWCSSHDDDDDECSGNDADNGDDSMLKNMLRRWSPNHYKSHA